MFVRRATASFTALFVFITSVRCLCGPTVAANNDGDQDHCHESRSHQCCLHHDAHDAPDCPHQHGKNDQGHCCDHCQQTQFFEFSNAPLIKPAALAWQSLPALHPVASGFGEPARVTYLYSALIEPSAIPGPSLLRLHCALNS
jgi:hypothetical protein